jgi:molybdopterin/thiamine biosynthesis adenylyltransferase
MQYEHLLKALGQEEFDKLSQKTVSVVGLGGIGSALAELLVRSGITVRVVEKDRVNEEDLDRLSLFEHKHISKFKATEAKKILGKINPDIQVKSFNEEITEQSLFLADADVIMDCTGSHSITPVLSKYCVDNNLPCIAGGIRDTKCIVVTSTDKVGVQEQLDKLSFDRTEGLVPASSKIIAGFMYVKALKLLLGREISKELLVFDVWNLEFEDIKEFKKTEADKKAEAKAAALGKPVISEKKPHSLHPSAAKKAPVKKKVAKKPAKKSTSTKKKAEKKPVKKKVASKKKTTKSKK